MTVYIKNGGVWRAASNGNIRIKWAGNWQTANYVYMKVNGQWQDSGYRGYPLSPQGIWVNGWDFNNVNIGFSGPAGGGAPVSHYEVAQNDANNSGMRVYTAGGSPSANFPVVEDGRYHFYVRSISTGGLASGWTGPVKVAIGHTEQGYWGNENRTRGWDSGHLNGWRNKDEPFWWWIPSSVSLNGLHWRNLYTPQSSILSPAANRTVNWIFNSGDGGPMNNHFGTMVNNHYADLDISGNLGNELNWGIVPAGTGWSTVSNSYYMLACDEIWIDGTETYQVSVYYVTRYRAENGYW